MKNKFPLILLFLAFFHLESCGQNNESKEKTKLSINKIESLKKNNIDSINANKILNIPTFRIQKKLNGYTFNLPFNYRITYIPNTENTSNSYYKFKWKINNSFSIDSDAKNFKRYSITNFIEYIPFSSNEEGEIYIVSSNNSPKLVTSDFLQEAEEIIYKDENSAIFKTYGKLRAFYFEHLPETNEYLIYLSDTPFQNIRPEIKIDEEINQLLHQLRFAKNISKPIIKQENNWNSLEKQLSILERNFLNKIISETKNSLSKDSKIKSYTPTDQGNIGYFTVFKDGAETDLILRKLFAKNNTPMTISDENIEFEYLRINNFRFFYNSEYTQTDKSDHSVVYRRNSSNSYCLITKPLNSNVVIFKEFPELIFMTDDYYKTEIEFYKVLFENYENL